MRLLTQIVTILNFPNNKMIIKKAYDRLGKFLLFQLVKTSSYRQEYFFVIFQTLKLDPPWTYLNEQSILCLLGI